MRFRFGLIRFLVLASLALAVSLPPAGLAGSAGNAGALSHEMAMQAMAHRADAVMDHSGATPDRDGRRAALCLLDCVALAGILPALPAPPAIGTRIGRAAMPPPVRATSLPPLPFEPPPKHGAA